MATRMVRHVLVCGVDCPWRECAGDRQAVAIGVLEVHRVVRELVEPWMMSSKNWCFVTRLVITPHARTD
jgi:hypothetical protein